MTGTRAMAIMTIGVMVESATLAATVSSSGCERVVVEAQSSDHVEHTGAFYQVGTALDNTPLFKSEGGFCLQYVEDESIADEDYSTFIELYTGSVSEPKDSSLDEESPTVDITEDFSRRSLQRCGHWAIGRMGPLDTAMYPMLKVSDCADHPAFVDEDSSWFRQECHDCDEETDIGYVSIFSETYPCDSFTWAPAATPTPVGDDAKATTVQVPPSPADSASDTGDGDGALEPTIPVFPFSPTDAPASADGEADDGAGAPGGGEQGHDEETEDAGTTVDDVEEGGDEELDEEEDRSVDLETAADDGGSSSDEDKGVDAVGVGVGVVVGVVVLGIVGMIVIKKARS